MQLCIRNDWFESGWEVVLPLHQAMWTAMLLSTAVAANLAGDLDTVVGRISVDAPAVVSYRLGDQGLESPLVWPDMEAVEVAASPEEAAQIIADAETRRAWCEEALRAAGLAMPSTVRDLVAVMQRLGIVRYHEANGGYWTMPAKFPRPEDVLPLPEGLAGWLRDFRKVKAVGPAEDALLEYAARTLGCPAQFVTTLQRLKRATGFGTNKLRAALDRLATDTGEIRLYRGQPPVAVAVKDLTANSRFQIAVDWDRINLDSLSLL
ncbi:DUF6042 family protein [Streptomyces sp. NPDC052496]|uniref:DUF6042 family protein n=1 Tax=Streptomyces sp. NPDC052496 TaxID=3154951 RepID=UPI003430829C